MSKRKDNNIDHLSGMRAFIKVIEAGSFSAVAKELHVSTSTIARRVSSIEESLGVTLLHRSTHNVSLTEAGQIYHERAIRLISEFDDTVRVVVELDAQPKGVLKLTAPVAFGRRYLAPLIGPFLSHYPEIELDVRLTDNHNDLVAGGFDLDIHEGENYLDNLIVQKISRNDCILCATPSYLDRCGRPIHPNDLNKHNCLRYIHPEGDPRWHFIQNSEMHSILPSGNLLSDHAELLLEATCSGLGIGEFEVWLVRDLLISGRLEPLLPQYNMINKLNGDFIYMAYLANRRSSAKLRVLINFLAENLRHIGELSEIEIQKIRNL
ncbi:TPA: LysR family transcriptional regulator [Acinetobacter baumannii]|uniref:LysR family transcriptional regulator n=1 Tax=Acinetobacter pittii TaxID=48296 RepID=UPI003AA91DC6|nr:LysR family transcriptional regulator [Acinetobacter baumannii]HCJ1341083.1 LysR family transcriptional regulator [Acinetobacter baumannii]